jgi:hypothetical protein
VISKRFVAKTTLGGLAIILAGLTIIFIFSRQLESVAMMRGIAGLKSLPWFNPAVGIPLAVFSLGSISLILWSRKTSSRLRRLLFGFVLIVDLASFGWFYEWKYISPGKDIITPTVMAQHYRALLEMTNQRMMPIRGVFGSANEIPPNISRLWGVPSASGYNTLILTRMSQFFPMFPSGELAGMWSSQNNRALDLMAVRYIFSPSLAVRPTRPVSSRINDLSDSSRWRHVEDIGDVSVYENLRAMPRAWLVEEVVRTRPEEALMIIQSSRMPDGRTYDPGRIALVEEPLEFNIRADKSGTARVGTLTNTSIEIHTVSPSPSFLVLSDANYPGWKVSVDGRPAHIFQTNFVLRGVAVPSGEHTIRFKFRPKSFYCGATISFLSVVLIIIILFKGANVRNFREKQSIPV